MAECLPPIAPPDARALILGSVPGDASIRARQYYAHPRNAFWPIIESLFSDGTVRDYEARVALARSSRIAIWDVLARADRAGSLDTAIVAATEVPNDLKAFLAGHRSITHVFFNGTKASDSFARHHGRESFPGVVLQRLPSTSPANASLSFRRKLEAWSVVATAVGEER
jgi:TDG/mug DNA glycosylase family protein